VVAAAPTAAGYLPPHGKAGGGGDSGGGGPIAAKKVTIAMDDGAVVVNGKRLTLMFDEKDLFAALGKPSRTDPGRDKQSNTLHTWDELGLFAYSKSSEPKVHAFAVAFARDPENRSFWPKKYFTGRMTVDGAVVTPDATIPAMNRMKKGLPFEKDEFLPDTFSIQHPKGKGSVYLRKGPNAGDGFVAIEIGVLPD
jgi:hypothetical protein